MFPQKVITRTLSNTQDSSTSRGLRISRSEQNRALRSLHDGDQEPLHLQSRIMVQQSSFAHQTGMDNMTTRSVQQHMATLLEIYANANTTINASPNHISYSSGAPPQSTSIVLLANQLSPLNSNRPYIPFQNTPRDMQIVSTVPTLQPANVSANPTPSTLQSPTTSFRPSWQILGVQKPVDSSTILAAQRMGIDISGSKYEGHMNERFMENKKCPDDLTTSLFLMGIHPFATDKEILETVTEGKVFVFDRKMPVPGQYNSSAADLTFFNRLAAEQYMQKFALCGINIKGRPVHVVWNKHHAWPARASELHQTRVIMVEGKHAWVNYRQLEAFLRVDISFRLVEGYQYNGVNGAYGALFVFGKVLGQSRAAFKKLREEVHKLGIADQVKITYGPDPCGD